MPHLQASAVPAGRGRKPIRGAILFYIVFTHMNSIMAICLQMKCHKVCLYLGSVFPIGKVPANTFEIRSEKLGAENLKLALFFACSYVISVCQLCSGCATLGDMS